MKNVRLAVLLAAIFWFIMFSPWTKGYVNFWLVMAAAAGILSAIALHGGKDRLKELYQFRAKWALIGLLSAAVLYAVFYVGNIVSAWLFDFAPHQIGSIYGTREQASPYLIGALLFLWIGPAEEIVWRGFIQDRLSHSHGSLKGYLVTTALYALVHIWAFNLMLFMAALICGLFWGWMFMRFKSVVPGLISHAVWDVAIFILLPIH